MEHDKLAMRLSLILQKLVIGEKFRLEDLSSEFNVCNRTIQRDLKRFAFLDITKDKDGYYCLDKSCLGLYGLKDIREFASFSGIEKLYPRLDGTILNEILESQSILNKFHTICPPPMFLAAHKRNKAIPHQSL